MTCRCRRSSGFDEELAHRVAHRFREPGRAERVTGIVVLVERDRTDRSARATGAIAVPSGPPGETATGIAGARVIACMSGSGGVPAPVRNHVGASGTADEMTGAHTRRQVARAVGDRAEAAEQAARRTVQSARRSRAVRRPVARCTATATAAGSKRPKPRFTTSTAPPVRGHVLRTGARRRGRARGRSARSGRRAADRDRTGRPDSDRRAAGGSSGRADSVGETCSTSSP